MVTKSTKMSLNTSSFNQIEKAPSFSKNLDLLLKIANLNLRVASQLVSA